MSHHHFLRCVITASCLCLILLPSFGMGADYETPPVLSAARTQTDVPLESNLYKVGEGVPTDGFMAIYTITSPYGEFTASGPGMLRARLGEIRALAALEAMQDDERFVQAAEDTAKEMATNLRRFIDKPKETLKGAPEGVSRFFSRTERTLKTGFQKLGDVREGRLPGVESDSASALPGGVPVQNQSPDTSLTEGIARAGGEAAINILGFDKQRRRLAKEIGVDPYTTNRALAEKLDEVTWAAFAGGLGVNVLTSLVPGGMILSTSSRLSDWVWDTSPGDLRVEIERTLASIGVEQPEIDRFLRHGFYTLSMQSVFAASLQALDGVGGRAEVMPLILSVASEGQARFLVQTLDMLRNYHERSAPLAELRVQGTIIGTTREGQPVVLAPVDYMSWTATLGQFALNTNEAFEAPAHLYVDGRVSDRARHELMKLGWSIEELSPLGSEAYPIN